MFNWRIKQKPKAQERSLEDLRKQLKTLDGHRLATLKGGQGIRKVPPALKACGGWLPQ